MEDDAGPEKELTHWSLESAKFQTRGRRSLTCYLAAENVLCEDTQTVLVTCCRHLKVLDFFLIRQVIF
jgi:hypothetical protein